MTTPVQPERRQQDRRGTIPLTVTSAAASAGTPLVSGPARLMGWSLLAGAGTQSAQGSVTSPGATSNICITGALLTGTYQVMVYLSLAGTLAQGTDNDNVQVRVTGAGQVVRLNNSIAAGDQIFGPIELEVTAATGNQIAVQNIAAGSVGSIYTASIVVLTDTQGTLTDGAQVVGTFGIQPGQADTEWFGEHGVFVGTDVQVHVTQGDVTGCVYVCKYEDY